MPFDLKAKVGPLPAWAWGGLIGIAVVAFVWTRQSNAAVDSAGAATIDGIDGAFGNASGGGGGGGATPGGTTTTNPDTTVDDSTTPNSYDYDSDYTLPDYSGVDFGDTSSLETWIARAVLWLSGQGWSPVVAQQQITDVLAGKAVPAGQDAAYKAAVAQFGAPPLGVDAGSVDLSQQKTAANTPKPPAKAGYNIQWSNQVHDWIYVKSAPTAADLAKSTASTIPFEQRSRLTVPELPEKPGYNRGWNEATRQWFYYKPA